MEVHRLDDLAAAVGGELHGDGKLSITGVGPIAEAVSGEIAFAENLRVLNQHRQVTGASALIVPLDADGVSLPHIKVANPRLAFIQVLRLFARPPVTAVGIHPSAFVHGSAKLGAGVAIGPQVIIESGAEIGNGCVLMGGVYVGADTVLGADCLVYPNVCIREGIEIGHRAIVHAGAVIGEDGFGFLTQAQEHVKVPHIGTVIIGDDVEIGANAAIERGTCGATVIGRGTKIGNLVQVGHNVKLGEMCLLVAMTGIAGSAVVGDRVTFAGQSGAAGHLTIGADSVVAARGLVAGNLPSGSFVSGFPARPHKEHMRVIAMQHKLPELLERIRSLEERVRRLSADEE